MKKKLGLMLDIGCGENKQANFLGLDKRELEGVDVVHDLEQFPYPFKDNSCHMILARGVFQYIKPWVFIDVMNELWRISKPTGQLIVSVPYSGSAIAMHDPAACNVFTENTFLYFDPNLTLWSVHKPKEWTLDKGFPVWQPTGVMEVILSKKVPSDG